MLVLTRRSGEECYLDLPNGDRITVVLLDVDRGKVRLGFDAPESVRIHRPGSARHGGEQTPAPEGKP